ncbi:hypothetical protein MMC13_007954 [Lambiella insularis]|nr:hypothetical protein [Lambiella insularis]
MARNPSYNGRDSFGDDHVPPFAPTFGQHQIIYPHQPSRSGRMAPPPMPLDPQLWSRSAMSSANAVRSDRTVQDGHRLHERGFLSTSPAGGGLDTISRAMLPVPRPGDQEADPLLRFWATPGPWNSQAIGGGDGVQTDLQDIRSQEAFARARGAIGPYREPARSDPGSHLTGRPSDSGYATKSNVTKSVVSTDYQNNTQETQSLAGVVRGVQIRPETLSHEYFHTDAQDSHSLSYESWSNDPRDAAATSSAQCECPECGAACKNQSDYKKHQQRHGKPFVCQETDCTRVKGFGTKNDLDRHKKSVHHIIPENSVDRSFKCAGNNCSKREKIWPRLDNFKSHCVRMHAEENLDELIKQSEVEPSRALDSAATGPRFSFGSKASESEGPEDSRHMDCSSVHGSEASIEHKVQESLSHPSSVHWKQSFPARASHAQEIMHAGDSIDENEDEAHRLVYEQYGGDNRRRFNTDSTMKLNNESCCRTSQACVQPKATSSPALHNAHTNPSQQGSHLGAQHWHGFSGTRSASTSLPPARAKAQEISKAIASDVTKCLHNNQTSAEEIELIIQTRVMSLLSDGTTKKRKTEDVDNDENIQPSSKRISCRSCPKTMGRPCDLKKHEKRHSRPWGCTHARCTKMFGSKNDWKRHENSQHHELETWRCNEPNSQSKINQCAKIYYRPDEFQDHLRNDHRKGDEEYLHEQCKMCRIGRNRQTRFWCGFCIQVVKLESRGVEAWDERFNHIDDHFKNEQNIMDWIPVDRDIPKGALRLENLHHNGAFATMDDSDSDHSDGEDNCRQLPRRRPPPPPPPPPPAPDGTAGDASAISTPAHHSFILPHPAVLQEQTSTGSRMNAMIYRATNGYQKPPPRSWYCVSKQLIGRTLLG